MISVPVVSAKPRVWSYFNKFTDHGNDYLPYIEGKTDTPMPLFVKPNRKLSVQDVKDMMRDHYEGTPLDISNDFGAGPYKTPYRLSPLNFKVGDKEYFNERPISTQQSGFVFVAQMRANKPDPIGGVFGLEWMMRIWPYLLLFIAVRRKPRCAIHV